MIDYELAKQLKEAWFPQITKRGWDICEHNESYFADLANLHCTNESVACPTLSELISACGDMFYSLLLKPRTGEWFATGLMWRRNQAKGKTPEEAVARLWLALNEEGK